jgi:type IV conjugative transfer system coupling protein TraD
MKTFSGKPFAGSFTQGGQIELHKLRMLKQVVSTTFKVSLGIAVISFVGLCALAAPWEAYWNLLCYYKALFRNSLSFLPQGFFDSSWFYWQPGQAFEISDYQLEHNVSYYTSALYVQSIVIKKLFWSLCIWVISLIGLSSFWMVRGSKKHTKQILKGTTLVNHKTMMRLIKRKERSDIWLGQTPLIKDKETEHFLISGTTGSGKTNCIIELLYQIRERGDHAVIVDSTSELLQRFFDGGKDLLLNPLDARSQNWDLWAECEEKYHFNEFAECLIPVNAHYHNDTFWTNAARDIFVETAQLLQKSKRPSYSDLLEFSIKKPLCDVQEFYANSCVASMMNEAAEKTSMSIRSTLATAIRGFESLAENGDFSIRRWIQSPPANCSPGGWLFLSCPTDQRALLRPLFSGWLSIATRSLMAMATTRPRGKVWFIIDELPSLNHLPELPKALAEVRKYGGCFVIGLQSISQAEDIYGQTTTQTISGLTGTKVLFRAAEAAAAKRMSELLGEQEVVEAAEGISFGAHQMRDGVSLNDHKRNIRTIPYTDLLQLDNLEAYLRLPGNYPITKIKFDYHDLPAPTKAFVKKPLTNPDHQAPS